MTKEQEIKRNMEILGISREEAEELFLSDHEDIDTPEQKEYTAKAKKLKRYEKSDAPRKKSEKVRKIDPDKKELLSLLVEGITNKYPRMVSVKNEAEFSFNFKENSYTVKLIKHRPTTK